MKELLFLGVGDSNEDEDVLNFLAPLNNALRQVSISGQDNNGDAPKPKRQKGNNSLPIPQQGILERKTRLSFELHPIVILHDLIYQDVDVSANISDDEHVDVEPEE